MPELCIPSALDPRHGALPPRLRRGTLLRDTFCPRPSAEKPDSRSARIAPSPPPSRGKPSRGCPAKRPSPRRAARRERYEPGRLLRSAEQNCPWWAHRSGTDPSASRVTPQNADFGPERRLGQSSRVHHQRVFLRNVQARYPFHDPRCVSKSAHYPVTFAWYRSHAATCRYKIGQTYYETRDEARARCVAQRGYLLAQLSAPFESLSARADYSTDKCEE